MTKEEACHYIDNLKWLKGYENTTIGGKTVGDILDGIKDMLEEQDAVKKCCRDCEYYGACHDE